MRILYNAIETPDKTVLESHFTHDFKIHIDSITGKKYGVDGGLEYARRIGDSYDYKELLVYDDGNHQTRRNSIRWGKNYDENLDKLSKTEYIKVKDLDTDHIFNILQLKYLNWFYRQVLEDEIIWRENNFYV